MPELPEVETIVQQLNASALIGECIKKVEVLWARSLATDSVPEFCQKLCGQTILKIGRRGKFIVFTLQNYTLLVHLRMTGKLILSKSPLAISQHERLQLNLSHGKTLHFVDQRKFGKWYLLVHPQVKFDQLGLEPLADEFTLEAFQQLLTKKSVQLKPFLLNQRYVVGLGNIYVDEALWLAKLHPSRKVNTLTTEEIKALYLAIPEVLKQGIENKGTSLGSHPSNYHSADRRRGSHQHHLSVFRRNGLPCPRCQTLIVKITLAQRGTHLCPSCQL